MITIDRDLIRGSKLRPNTTPVPNFVLDIVGPTLSGGSFRVLLALCRYTYGFGKVADGIATSSLMKQTGLSKQSVITAVQDLERRRVIVVIRKQRVGRRQGWNIYAINERFPQVALGRYFHEPRTQKRST